MSKAKKLRLWDSEPQPTVDEVKRRVEVLKATVEKYLPEFTRGVKESVSADKGRCNVFHQDAFASTYKDDEYTLLGMAVKYAGLFGNQVFVVPDPGNQPSAVGYSADGAEQEEAMLKVLTDEAGKKPDDIKGVVREDTPPNPADVN